MKAKLNILIKSTYIYIKVVLLSLITISFSCTNDSINESYSVEGYVKDQISIGNEIMNIIQQEDQIDLSLLSNNQELTTITEIIDYLNQANFENSSELSRLIVKANNNSTKFVELNPNFINNKSIIIENIFHSEIEKQVPTLSSLSMRGDPCEEDYNVAGERCERTYYFSLVASGIVGIFTGGVGAATGTVIATINLANCLDYAFHDYTDCLEENK